MKLILENTSASTLYTDIKKLVKKGCEKTGFEYNCIIKNKLGEGNITSYDFGDGFNLIHFKLNLFTVLELSFNENSDNVLRYIFSLSGDMIHTLTPSLRYRITSKTSSIVAVKNRTPQVFTFPAQKAIDIFFLQIDTKRFSTDLKKELLGVPEELSNVLTNEKMSDHFFYHSNYSLDIGETLNELMVEDKEGLVKRFYLESKALELLWLHTARFKYENKTGFNRSLVRYADLEKIREARTFVRNNFHEEISLTSLARSIGTNETKLKAGFSKLYGKTFSEILREDRLLKAKHLINENRYSIKEIAAKCGYKSVSMFGKRFKEKYGISPGKARPGHPDKTN